MSNNIILNIKELDKYYDKLHALKMISLEISKGSIHGILGPNGSGKSTLMRIIAGLIKSWDGTISFKNKKLNYNNPKVLSNFGFMIESPAFYEYLSAIDNLKLFANLTNTDYKVIYQTLELVKLENRMYEKVKNFSYGMKQRLGIAQTLLHQPEILILDEPNNGLDPAGIKDMGILINRLQSEGKTIIISTHILSEVENLCTNVSILKKGVLIASLSMNDIHNNSNKFLIKTIEVNNARLLLDKVPNIIILEINEDSLIVSSKDNLNFNTLVQLLNDKISIQSIKKESGLIDFFYD
jgi:ABC-type multidrug transport system ATPase subunit|tara:strand:- start:2159 stop:3046 length:888 start_codon:yes stop_codon:yes gene_type:complete